MLHLRTTRPSCCKLVFSRNDRCLLILLSATALAQLVQVSVVFQRVSVAALVDLVVDMGVRPDLEAAVVLVVFLALPPATSVVDQTTMLVIARHKL
jgi:hypothetical protein